MLSDNDKEIRKVRSVRILKYCLFCFTVLFLMLITWSTLVGIAQFKQENKYHILLGFRASVSARNVIFLFVLFVPFILLGLWGTIKENHLMVYTYAFFAASTVLVTGGAIIMCYLDRNELERKQARMKHVFKDKLDEYNTTKEVKNAFNEVQREFRCCGVLNASDWGDNIPKSCCIAPVGDHCPAEDAFQEGCWEEVMKLMFRFVNNRIYLGTLRTVIKIALCVFTCFVANVFKKKQKIVKRRMLRKKQEEEANKKKKKIEYEKERMAIRTSTKMQETDGRRLSL